MVDGWRKHLLKIQREIFQFWHERYWASIEGTYTIYRTWNYEFYHFAMKQCERVMYQRIMDYNGNNFLAWALPLCQEVFGITLDSMPQVREAVYDAAMQPINLRGILVKYHCPHEMMEDTEQEVRIKVWLNMSKYNPTRAQFLTWVTTIAHNTVVDIWRRAERSGENAYEQLPLEFAEHVPIPEDNSMKVVLDALDKLKAQGEMTLVNAIMDYLDGYRTELPDVTKLVEVVA